MDRRVNRDGQPTRTHHGGVAFLVREDVHYEDKPDVTISAVAPNDDTTECLAIQIHDPRLVKPVTILNVYVPPIRAVDGRDQCFDPNFSQLRQTLSFWEISMPIAQLGTQTLQSTPPEKNLMIGPF